MHRSSYEYCESIGLTRWLKNRLSQNLAWRPAVSSTANRTQPETAAHRRERRRRTAARTLTRVASGAQLLKDHHSADMSPRCKCPSSLCGKGNFWDNAQCYYCNAVMPKRPVSVAPTRVPGAQGNRNGRGSTGGSGTPPPKILCTCCGSKTHLKADCKQKDKACHRCGKSGHIAAVCRSKRAAGAADFPAATTAASLSEADFQAELARRGCTTVPTAAGPIAPCEHSAKTISSMSLAKDRADATFQKCVGKLAIAQSTLEKVKAELAEAAMEKRKAEKAFMDEVAATHKAVAPQGTPPALDLAQFLSAKNGDFSKLAVNIGGVFDLTDMPSEDAEHVSKVVEDMKASFAAQMANVFTPMLAIVEKAKVEMKEVTEAQAKKRKSMCGQAVAATPAASSASSATTPAETAAALAKVESDLAAKKLAEAEAATAEKRLRLLRTNSCVTRSPMISSKRRTPRSRVLRLRRRPSLQTKPMNAFEDLALP